MVVLQCKQEFSNCGDRMIHFMFDSFRYSSSHCELFFLIWSNHQFVILLEMMKM